MPLQTISMNKYLDDTIFLADKSVAICSILHKSLNNNKIDIPQAPSHCSIFVAIL